MAAWLECWGKKLRDYIIDYILEKKSDDRYLNKVIQFYYYCQSSHLPPWPGAAVDQPYVLTHVIFPSITEGLMLRRQTEAASNQAMSEYERMLARKRGGS